MRRRTRGPAVYLVSVMIVLATALGDSTAAQAAGSPPAPTGPTRLVPDDGRAVPVPAGAVYAAMNVSGFDANQVQRSGHYLRTLADGTQVLLDAGVPYSNDDSAQPDSFWLSHSIAWYRAASGGEAAQSGYPGVEPSAVQGGAVQFSTQARKLHTMNTVFGNCGDSYLYMNGGAVSGLPGYYYNTGFDVTGTIVGFGWDLTVNGYVSNGTDHEEFYWHDGGSYTGFTGGTYHNYIQATGHNHYPVEYPTVVYYGNASGQAILSNGSYCTSAYPGDWTYPSM
jgi:hypothetical protein